MEALANMKVSFKVGLPDGTFAFDMAPLAAPSIAGVHAESGMKLHLTAAVESGNVVLTLFTSGKSTAPPNVANLEAVPSKPHSTSFAALTSRTSAESKSQSPAPTPPGEYGAYQDHSTEPDHDESLDFMTYSHPTTTCEPLDLSFQPLALGSFEAFGLQESQNNFDNFTLDCEHLITRRIISC
jgi:hypothetical protein